MDYKINEKTLLRLMDVLIKNAYGEISMHKNEDAGDDYVFFISELPIETRNSEIDDNKYVPFQKNTYGTLFIEDLKFKDNVKSYFEFLSPEEFIKLIKKYFKNRFEKTIRAVRYPDW
jgi:hypothetical protein